MMDIMSRDNNNPDRNDIRRRDFLKKSGAAAGVGAFGFTGLSGNVKATEKTDFEITGRNELSDREAQRYVGDAVSQAYTQDLARKMMDENNLRPAFSNAFGIKFETDDPKLNAMNPVAVSLPLVSKKSDRGGLLVMTMADTEDGRTPLSALGITAESPSASGPSTMSAGEVKSYAVVDEQASVVNSRTVDPSGVGTQGIGCDACKLVASELCDYGAGKVSKSFCIRACLPFVSGVATYVACAGACALILDYITGYACDQGADYVCNQAGIC